MRRAGAPSHLPATSFLIKLSAMTSLILTPYERRLVDATVRALADQPRLRALRVFGSRARGEARVDSDLDIAVVFDGGYDRAAAQRVAEVEAEAAADGPVQLVPVFEHESPSLLRSALAREGVTVWTRT